MNKTAVAFGFFLFLMAIQLPQAFATSIDSETLIGSLTKSEALNAFGDFFTTTQKSKPGDTLSWSLGYDYVNSYSVDSTTQIGVTDVTSIFTGGLEWENDQEWTFGIDLTYASTPDEYLRDYGPAFSVGNTQELGSAKAKKSSGVQSASNDFVPTVTEKLTFSDLLYQQTLGFKSRTGKVVAKTGTNSITQTSLKAEVNYAAREWITAKAFVEFYHYNRDVNAFLATLDQGNAVHVQLASGLASTVSGLPKSEEGLGFQFYFSDVWEFDVNETLAVSAVDGSDAWTTKLVVARDVGASWHLGLGYENDSAPGANDNLVVADADYTF